MAETIKVLAQSNPLAATLTDAYTVPASTSAVVSTLFVANRSGTGTSYRVSVAIAGAADNLKQYIYYDVPLDGNDTFGSTTGMSLGAGDIVRVYATLATLSFTLMGAEIT
jgi:hypothetical protein